MTSHHFLVVGAFFQGAKGELIQCTGDYFQNTYILTSLPFQLVFGLGKQKYGNNYNQAIYYKPLF